MVGGWLEVFWLPAVLCLAFFSVISLVVGGLGVLPGSFVGVGCLPGFFSVIDLVVGGLGVSCLASFCGGLGVGWGLFSICLAAAFWLWFCLESLILAQDERWRRA